MATVALNLIPTSLIAQANLATISPVKLDFLDKPSRPYKRQGAIVGQAFAVQTGSSVYRLTMVSTASHGGGGVGVNSPIGDRPVTNKAASKGGPLSQVGPISKKAAATPLAGPLSPAACWARSNFDPKEVEGPQRIITATILLVYAPIATTLVLPPIDGRPLVPHVKGSA